ncbi:MAG: adenylate/guanylate cyclase domain-containing protein [Archangium sp.]|nr:adenylate/guanylate cyclase domain-containing protein [Archangium sp.]
MSARDEQVTQAIRDETSRFFARGGLYAAALGGVAVLALATFWLVTGDGFFALPMTFAVVGSGWSLLISAAAKRRLLTGLTRNLVMLPLVSLPTGLFLAAHFLKPAGAATFLTGPFINLYSFLVVITGFLLSARLSTLAGFVVALEYLFVFWLARPFLAAVQSGDAAFAQDLSSWPVAFNRALMFIATGTAVGGFSLLVRRLILRVIDMGRETAMVNRLFGQYVSEEARLRIVNATARLKGERVSAVVLFSDLRGFTTFSEGRAPEEVVQRLNAYFEKMVTAVHQEGGVVDKFIGDAVMATFGALNPLENPAASAMRAAEAMRAGLAALNAEWASQGLEPFENGVGLHLGDVVVGPIGSEARKDFTVIGDAVNTASRIESLCKDKGVHVIVSDAVYQRLGEPDRARFKALGTSTVKGRQESLVLWGSDLG